MSPAVLAVFQTKAMWYFTRGSGAFSFILLTLVFVLGVAQLLGVQFREATRLVIAGLHKNLSLLIVIFVVLHAATSILDGFVAMSWIDIVVPFKAGYRPIWVGLGAIAFDLMLAVIATSLLRVRLGYRSWRLVHWTSYAMWPVAMVHTLGTGSDVRKTWLLAVLALLTMAALAATAYRVWQRHPAQVAATFAAAGAIVLVPLAVMAWATQGPLQDGWPNGKPEMDLSAAPVQPGQSVAFSGKYTRALTPTGAPAIEVNASLKTAEGPSVLIVLFGDQNASGLVVQSGRLSVGPSDDPTAWNGAVSTTVDGHIIASISDLDGNAERVQIDVRLGSGGSVTGTLTSLDKAK